MDDRALEKSAALHEEKPPPQKRVLNIGCGPQSPRSLHPAFKNPFWSEVRLDIDDGVNPDLVGSVTDMSAILDADFDAIWCSHNLEHLFNHEVAAALAEIRRVLKPDGFALITCPDLEDIAHLIVNGRTEDAAYPSALGPITALDMLYGHSGSIERGNRYMAHRTGFTTDRLGRLLIDGGFVEALVVKGPCYDLWALALMPNANKAELRLHLQAHQLNFFTDG